MCCVSGSAAEKDLLCLCVFTLWLEVVLLPLEAADLLQFGNTDRIQFQIISIELCIWHLF